MDLLCHCVSMDCTNCPRYKNWLEGKNPNTKRQQEETDEKKEVANEQGQNCIEGNH